MQWIPTWLARSYSRTYAERGTDWLDFNEAKVILGIDDKRVLSFHLAKLEERGFLISKRDSVDRRKKYFRLIEPSDVVFVYNIQSRARSGSLTDRLAAALKYMDFVIGGSYASYVYSGYASPGKIDIYVNKADRDRWISLLSDRSTAVSTDDELAEKTAKTNVHIHSTLTQENVNDSLLLDGIRYVKPEILVVDGLREQTELSLTDFFAILIKRRKQIDFERLLKFAENVERELGASLEIINSEAKKKVFGDDMIRKIRTKADLSRKKFFPASKTEETVEYKEISERWNLKICLSRALVNKIVTDLIR